MKLAASRVAVAVFLTCAALAGQAPSITPGGIVNSASFAQTVEPGSEITIYGSGFSDNTRLLSAADFPDRTLPKSVDGLSVTVGGRLALIHLVSPTQLNVITPEDMPTGPIAVTVIRNGISSNPLSVKSIPLGPALFVAGPANGRYAAATVDYPDGKVKIAAVDLLYGPNSGVATALAGQIITVYGTGFGPLKPAGVGNALPSGASELAGSAHATIGGIDATVLFAGRVAPGLDQINIEVPATLADGEYPIAVDIDGAATQRDVFLSVGKSVNAVAPGIYNPIAKALNRFMVLGASITTISSTGSVEQWPSMAMVHSDARLLNIGNGSVPGNGTAEMLARVPDIIAMHPTICVIAGGTNDLVGVVVAKSMANIDQMVKQLQANKIRPILSSIPPRDGFIEPAKALNAAIQQYATSNGLMFVDFYSVLVDPATSLYLPGYSLDGVHPTPIAARLMSKLFVETVSRIFMPQPSLLPTPANNSGNFLTGGLFQKDSDSDGLADGWAISRGAGSTRLVTDPDGFRWQSITAGKSALEIAKLFTFAGGDSFSDGDRVAFVAKVKFTPPPGGGGKGTIRLNLIHDGVESVITPLSGWTTEVNNVVYFEFVIPEHCEFINLYAAAEGNGSALQFGAMGLFNLSKH